MSFDLYTNWNSPSYSVIVPLYNEEETIEKLYSAIIVMVTAVKRPYEIVFVDDGSKDATFQKAEKLASINPNLRVIKFRKNYGQTPAMVAGIQAASGKILITMDGDLQNDPSDIPLFLNKIEEGFDIVVGWRHKRQDHFVSRKLPSVIANWLIGKVTGVPIKDNGCSLKAYKAELIKNVPLYSEMHRFIPAVTSVAGARIAEIKVQHHPRRYGESKYGLSRIYKVLVDLITIKAIISFSANPLFGFGILSALSAIISLGLFFIAFIDIFFLPEAGIMIPLGASFLMGVLSIFLMMWGMLGELIYRTGNLKIENLWRFTAFMESDVKTTKVEVL